MAKQTRQHVKQILLLVRRSNGDVLLASPLIQHLHAYYPEVAIDLLVNADTLGMANALPLVRYVIPYTKAWQTLRLRQYDLAISLTTTDSSVLYARLAGKTAISAVDTEPHKAWWKRWLLSGSYSLDKQRHVLHNNLQALQLLKIPQGQIIPQVSVKPAALVRVQALLQQRSIERFVIFHPSTQYAYKVYPEALRQQLLMQLAALGMPIIITGAKTPLDLQIKATLTDLPAHIHDLIGETSLDEYIALSSLALAYIGGDTLNMHIAAAQDKQVFAIFGSTLLPVWSPWCNALQHAASVSQPQQTYGNITVFQAALPCVPCGKAGCNDDHGRSECLYQIPPDRISTAVQQWLSSRASG